MEKIEKVSFEDDFLIYLLLSDGKNIVFDMKPKLNTARFKAIDDETKFKSGELVSVRRIVWENETELTLSEII